MATTLHGERTWSGGRDEQGYRTYLLVSYVRSDTEQDGPANVLRTPGLPLPGAMWVFFGDLDPWVWCRPTATISPVEETREGSKVILWKVEQEFSNSPLDGQDNKCQDQNVDDPVLEPPRIRINTQQFQEEATKDRFGKPILSSSWERIQGTQNEWDASRFTVCIEQNVLALEGALLNYCKDAVNSSPLWGFPARWIKFRLEGAEEHYYGQCYKYWTRSLAFEIKENGWDRDFVDQGTKVLNGHWGSAQGTGATLELTTGFGTGCTVNVTAVDGEGRVRTVTLGSGGSGYPVKTTVPLLLEGSPNGIGCVVLARTNSSGVVTGVGGTFDGLPAEQGLYYGVGTSTTRSPEGGNDGAIKSATINSGGSDYPPSSKIALKVVSVNGSGAGGTVIVSTNSAGVVTTYEKVGSPGSGYQNGPANTEFETGWILDDIDGEPPDPNNPAHFIRAKDRQGENTSVALDGGGCPVDDVKLAGKIHAEKYREVDFLLLGIPVVIGP